MSRDRRLDPARYREMVTRVQAAVAEHVPPGSSVLVVSKGDAALVELPAVTAAHFPQSESGDYVGYHPHDSAAATAQLEDLRRRGAEYLVLPATARWWLDFYAGFASHLANHGELVASVEDACLIFGLGGAAPASESSHRQGRPRASVDQLRDYLENLVPAETELVVLEAEDGLAAALAPVRATALEVRELESDRLLRGLHGLARRGAEYLVVPRGAEECLEEHLDAVAEIEENCRKVADQHHLCRVFELSEMGGEAFMGEEK